MVLAQGDSNVKNHGGEKKPRWAFDWRMADSSSTLKFLKRTGCNCRRTSDFRILRVRKCAGHPVEDSVMAKKRSAQKPRREAFQFRVALEQIRPPIWRRIRVLDCSLDEFHEHLQTAMGWTNSHLHQFEIAEVRYGDPQLLGDAFDLVEDEDSRFIDLSEVVAGQGKGLKFRYVYDFGDTWEHSIEFEGMVATEPNVKYPVCVEGAHACPPEDCGGVPGYEHLLEVLANSRHPEFKELRQWVGAFDSEQFTAQAATRRMHAGLPDWRSMM
jgi:hypothetical protein